jgi:hypothetical protein
MLREGFEVTSDENGFQATGSFLLLWANAFQFHDEIMGIASAGRWRFPGSSSSSLYAMSARIVPIALDDLGNALPITAALGMAPGEFWTWARVDVHFRTPSLSYSADDDAGGSQHLDPSSPIYGCEQSVRIGTRAEAFPAEGLKFDSAPTISPKEATVYKSDDHLTLHWPFVPAMKWQKYRLFRGTVNEFAIFDCVKGQLLFTGADIQPAQGPGGRPGLSVTIPLMVGDDDWNKLPHPTTGILGLVNKGGGTTDRLYPYKPFANLSPFL